MLYSTPHTRCLTQLYPHLQLSPASHHPPNRLLRHIFFYHTHSVVPDHAVASQLCVCFCDGRWKLHQLLVFPWYVIGKEGGREGGRIFVHVALCAGSWYSFMQVVSCLLILHCCYRSIFSLLLLRLLLLVLLLLSPGLLMALQALHCFWFYLILRMVYRLLWVVSRVMAQSVSGRACLCFAVQCV